MKIQNRQQFLVVLTIVAAGLFVGVDFIFTPLAGWWAARSAQITELHKKVDNGKRLLKYESEIRNHWDEMRGDALSPNTALAEQQLLKAFDNWRNSSGAEITGITPQWKSDSTNYMTLSCRVEAAGDIGTLTRFLYAVEKGPLPLRVDNVELNSKDATGQQLTLGLEIEGLALMQQDKK